MAIMRMKIFAKGIDSCPALDIISHMASDEKLVLPEVRLRNDCDASPKKRNKNFGNVVDIRDRLSMMLIHERGLVTTSKRGKRLPCCPASLI